MNSTLRCAFRKTPFIPINYKITFTVDELSPFAIVVDTDAQNPEIPNTNTAADMTAQTLISAAAVALFSMLLVVVLRQKKIKE